MLASATTWLSPAASAPPLCHLAMALRLPVFHAMTRPPASSRAGAALDEGSLIAAARKGDRQAFDELYRRHVDQVWRRLTHLLGPDPEREDLTQQIFIEVFARLDHFRGEASLRTYFYRVAVNVACDHLRRRKRAPVSADGEWLDGLRAPGTTPEAHAEHRQRLALTWSLLEHIKPKKRIAFLLRVVEGLSLEEIAEQVGSNVATVAQRIRHAHDELQTMLARREGRA